MKWHGQSKVLKRSLEFITRCIECWLGEGFLEEADWLYKLSLTFSDTFEKQEQQVKLHCVFIC